MIIPSKLKAFSPEPSLYHCYVYKISFEAHSQGLEACFQESEIKLDSMTNEDVIQNLQDWVRDLLKYRGIGWGSLDY